MKIKMTPEELYLSLALSTRTLCYPICVQCCRSKFSITELSYGTGFRARLKRRICHRDSAGLRIVRLLYGTNTLHFRLAFRLQSACYHTRPK